MRQIAGDSLLVLERGSHALAVYFAARAAEAAGGEAARRKERERQAAWLAEHVL